MPRGHTLKDMNGLRFGRLVVTGFSHVTKGNNANAFWHCQCDCGKTSIVRGRALRTGNTMSCGCRGKETLHLRQTHGMTHTPTYSVWECMINRCTCPTNRGYRNYGGRGITVCERWRTFENFFADMGCRPSPKHTIDRFPDNNGNYEPGNCRWATRKEQMRNCRINRIIEIDGVAKTLAEWVEERGLPYNTILYRLRRGWSVKQALESPINRRAALVPGGDGILSDPIPALEQ